MTLIVRLEGDWAVLSRDCGVTAIDSDAQRGEAPSTCTGHLVSRFRRGMGVARVGLTDSSAGARHGMFWQVLSCVTMPIVGPGSRRVGHSRSTNEVTRDTHHRQMLTPIMGHSFCCRLSQCGNSGGDGISGCGEKCHRWRTLRQNA
eukprot:Selendium_serpulae@DN10617_c0_g1_i1.p1